MERYADLFAGIRPWAGEVPKGFLVDFTGALTDGRFGTMWGVDPDRHWLVPVAIAGSTEPVLFPVGAAGSGAQNAIVTNSREGRANPAFRKSRSFRRSSTSCAGRCGASTSARTAETCAGPCTSSSPGAAGRSSSAASQTPDT
jgi:hypothetical protein